MNYICEECGKLFSRRKRERAREPQKYCSRQCNGLSLRRNIEWHEKLSVAKKGRKPWNKGVAMWKTRNHPRGTLGMKFPNRTSFSEQTLKKMSESHRGKILPENRRGKNHHWWRGGLTTENVRDRASAKYKEWKINVFIRDGRACVKCGNNKNIHAHHVVPFVKRKDLRFIVSNGITLCWDCHGKLHGIVFTDHALNHCEKCKKKIKVGARFCRECRGKYTADKYRCMDCGVHIEQNKKTKRCKSCAAKHRMRSRGLRLRG